MDPGMVAIIGLAAVINVALFSLFLSMFQKCPPNTALIVFGALSKEPKIVVGGGTVVFPLIESCRPLSLEVLTIKMDSKSPIYTKDGASVFIKAIVLAKLGGDEASIRAAAENFLSKGSDEVGSIANMIVATQLRKIASEMNLSDLVQHPDLLAEKALQLSIQDWKKLGLNILSINIQEVHHTSKIETPLEQYVETEDKQNSYIAGDLAK